MEVIIRPLLYVLLVILDFFFWVLLINVIFSWLGAFGILNPHSRFVNVIASITYRITEPFLNPIRRFLPEVGGLDFSPFIFFLLIIFLQRLIQEIMLKF